MKPISSREIKLTDSASIRVRWYDDPDPDLSYLETDEDTYYQDLLKTDKRYGKGTYSPRYARRLARQYARQDSERLEAYRRNVWSMLGCEAALMVNGEEKHFSAVWGVESDAGQQYHAQIEQEEIAEVLSDFDKTISDLISGYYKTIEELKKLRSNVAINGLESILYKPVIQ